MSRRPTRQRTAVAAVLDGANEFITAQELHARLREHGEAVGLATVYRTVQAMAASGEVDVLRGDDGEASYRRCGPSHHHHLVCRRCGATVEVQVPEVEQRCAVLAEQHGYDDVSHTLEIFGNCRDCRISRP
jgi:Fur family ferric uptake transcriptional regulator